MTTARFMLALSLSFAALCGRAESIDLSGVYQLAIENDPQLGAAEASFLAQSEVVPQARAGLLPSLNLSSSYSDTTSPSLREFNPLTGTTLFEDTTTTSRSWRAGLVQPLFRMDRWHQYQQSKSIRDQAQAGYSSEALSLIVRVAETYLAILEAQDALDSTNAERSAVQRQLEQVQQRFDVGLVAITDVLESTASFDRTTVNVIEAEGAQAQSFEPLMRLTGRAFTSVQGLMAEFPVRHPEPQNEAAWVAAALEKNTTILAGKAALA
ncbi:TolC family protein, partial [Pseudomonadales bacterium]|nr:TolC family protein [Pseudomonadales bacterium]